ncbi:hypothetical protein V8F20_006869 [Naviculisporaceae sp. PSN 640]
MIKTINNKLNGILSSSSLTPRAFDLTCVVIGALGTVFGVITCAAPGFLPPIPPSWTAEEVVQYYQDHRHGLLAGAIASVLTGTFYSISGAIFSVYLGRVPNLSKTIVYVQFGAATCIACVFILAGTTLAAIAYRLDRNPEITLALSDLFWLTFMMPMPPLQVQLLCVGWAALADKRPKPAFPRWLGIYNILYSVTSIPVYAVHSVYDGPLAWDGAFTFWFTLAGWGISCAFEYIIMFRYYWIGADAELAETESNETGIVP